MTFLTPSDFIGKYELHKGLYDTEKLESYITKYEARYLMQLLGVDLFNAFMGDVDEVTKQPKSPNFATIFNPLYEDINMLTTIESDGVLEMLKGFVYFEYSKDLLMQQTTFGGVQQKAENSTVLNTLQTLIYSRYNEAIKTYKAIQHWILLNTQTPLGQAVDFTYLNNTGSGYISMNNVTLTPMSGAVLSTFILNGGSNYVSANGIGVTGGSGSGLLLDITDLGGAVDAVTIANFGSDYVLNDTVIIDSGDTNAEVLLDNVTQISYGSTLTADIKAYGIGGVNGNQLNASGSGYSQQLEVNLLNGSGSAAVIKISEVGLTGEILDFTVISEGYGYQVGDILTVDGGNLDAEIEVTSVFNGEIKELKFVDAGINWQIGDTFLVTGGNSDCFIQLTYVGIGDLSQFKGQNKLFAYWI